MKYNLALRSQKERLLSQDGSYTLYSKEFDEPYHATKEGALHETLEKHVKPALLLQRDKSTLCILDICFGLGYNTLATLYYIRKYQLRTKVHILSPEFDEALIRSLDNFVYPPEFDGLKEIIHTLSHTYYYQDEQFTIEILLGDARDTIPQIKHKIDIVYQDAFSPVQNPLLWTQEYFRDIRKICKEDVILTTYSTAASVRLGLYENGFYIFKYSAAKIRNSTIASPMESLATLEGVAYIDMELKKRRNTEARSMRDREYLG